MKFNEITKIPHKFSKLRKYPRITTNKNFQYALIQRKFRKTTALFILHPHMIDCSKSMEFDDDARYMINVISSCKQRLTRADCPVASTVRRTRTKSRS